MSLSEISRDGLLSIPQEQVTETSSAKTQTHDKAVLIIFRQHGSNPNTFQLKEITELEAEAITSAVNKKIKANQTVHDTITPLAVIATAAAVALGVACYFLGSGQAILSFGFALVGTLGLMYVTYSARHCRKQAEGAQSDLYNQVLKAYKSL
jgi:hypothetical protein